MALWTPPAVSRELEREAQQDAAQIRLAAALRGQLDWWTRELKAIDERLEMVWFDESVDIAGVVPCRYHVIRWNSPPTPPSIIPVTGPEGEFIEPNSAVFDKLRAGDLWSERAQRERREIQEEITRRKQRQREREQEERQEEILERWMAATRTQVSMNRDTAWSQNAAGARAARAHARKKA